MATMTPDSTATTVERVFAQERARVLATLVRSVGDFELESPCGGAGRIKAPSAKLTPDFAICR